MGRVASTLQSFPAIVTAARSSAGADEASTYDKCGNTGTYGHTHVLHVFPFPTRVRNRRGPCGRVEHQGGWHCDNCIRTSRTGHRH